MLERLLNVMLFLLNPRSAVEYVWKLLVLCMLTTSIAITTEGMIGTEISNPVQTYFLIVFVVSSPFFTLAMVVVRRMQALQAELNRLASTDILTGLANRRAFFEVTGDAVDGQLLLLDIDHFKSINDNFGHSVGDEVLKAVAEYLTSHVRSTDIVARIGGEEFAIYLPEASADMATQIGDRIVKGLTFETERVPELKVTLSAGLAEASEAQGVSELIRRADAALYQSKRNGRARLSTWMVGVPSRPNPATA